MLAAKKNRRSRASSIIIMVWPLGVLFLTEVGLETTTSARPSSMPCLRIWVMSWKFSSVHLASLILRYVSNKSRTYKCLTVPGKVAFSLMTRPTAFATFLAASSPREENEWVNPSSHDLWGQFSWLIGRFGEPQQAVPTPASWCTLYLARFR